MTSFTRAEKRRVKIKIGMQGPSGSGKTWGALALAANLWPGAKIALIDTENESASLYADRFEFCQSSLSPPFTSARYASLIEDSIRERFDVLIIDSISHQWDGEGGVLRRKEELDQRPGANSWANWAKFTPEHTAFIESIKQAPIHIIATMRARQDYILEQSEKGKSKPVKVGMAPIVRDGTDYEFSIVFDVQMDHKAMVSKNRTGLFEGEVLDLASPSVADRLRSWLESGAEITGPAPETWKAPTPKPVDEPPKSRTANPSGRSAAARQTQPQPQQGVWELADDILTCEPLNAQPMDRHGQKFVALKLNEKLNGNQMAFCFITTLFGALSHCVGQRTTFRINFSDQNYITDVLEISGRKYAGGVPATEQRPEPHTPTPTMPRPEPQTNEGGRGNPSAVSGNVADGRGESVAAPSASADPKQQPLEITDDDLPF